MSITFLITIVAFFFTVLMFFMSLGMSLKNGHGYGFTMLTAFLCCVNLTCVIVAWPQP